MPRRPHGRRPPQPEAGRQAGGRAAQAERVDPLGRVGGQPHPDHAAERHAGVRRVARPRSRRAGAARPRPGRRGVYGPGGRGRAAVPAAARSGAAGTARPAPRAGVPERPGRCRASCPSTSTGWRRAGPSRAAASRTGQSSGSDIEEDGLVLALQADVEPEPPGAVGGAAIRVSRRAGVGERGQHRVGGVGLRLVGESRSGSRPGRAGRGRTRTRPGAAPRSARPGWAAAGPERDDAVPAVRRRWRSGRSRGTLARCRGAARVVGVVEAAVRVGLPRLDQRVRDRARPPPSSTPAGDRDRARGALGHHVRAVRPGQRRWRGTARPSATA